MRAMTARLLLGLSRAARAAAEALHDGADASAQGRLVAAANAGYDMAAEPDEAYYAERYLARLAPALSRLKAGPGARLLDLGCGHGRLSVPLGLAVPGAELTGVDLSEPSLSAARARAAAAGLAGARFLKADAAAYARALPASSLDAVVCCEVLYNVPAYREVLADLARALRPGGLLFASFRSRWYELCRAVKARDFDSAEAARDRREGRFGGGAAWSAWHSPADLRAELAAAGFAEAELSAVGPLSGLAEDPWGGLARPAELPPLQRARLGALEDSLAVEAAAQGRYILAVAWRKP